MAYRLVSLLPLLAMCVSAATPIAEIQPSALDMSENMDTGVTMESVVPDMANAPVAATASSAAQAQATASPAAQAQATALAGPPVISHAQANSVIQAAVQKAIEIKSPSNIAVTDPYGHLVSFLRMDGAILASIDVAQKKAKTVSMFGGKFRTGDLYNATSPGGSLYGIGQTNNGLVFFGGGVPLKFGGATGQYVGALGVSGGTVEQDVAIASAAAASFK